jgi:hypothetical protein
MMKAGREMSIIINPTHPVATATARKAKRYGLHRHDADKGFKFISIVSR